MDITDIKPGSTGKTTVAVDLPLSALAGASVVILPGDPLAPPQPPDYDLVLIDTPPEGPGLRDWLPERLP